MVYFFWDHSEEYAIEHESYICQLIKKCSCLKATDFILFVWFSSNSSIERYGQCIRIVLSGSSSPDLSTEGDSLLSYILLSCIDNRTATWIQRSSGSIISRSLVLLICLEISSYVSLSQITKVVRFISNQGQMERFLWCGFPLINRVDIFYRQFH